MRKHIYVNDNLEIIQDDFEKVIEKYMGQDAANCYIEERDIIEGDDFELMADGYFQMINNSIIQVNELLEYIDETKRLNRKDLIEKIKEIRNTLENY